MLAQPLVKPPRERLRAHRLALGQVDQLAVEPVPRRQPLVLVEHLVRVVAELLAGVEVLGQLLDHRLDQRRQRERVLDVRLRVHRADLDRAEVRVRPHVVPEPGVVLHHAGVDHEADPALVVRPAVVVRRDADARELAEDRHPGRGQAGVVAAPERRVGAEGEQDRHVHAHPVGDVDRLLGIVEPDVDVQPEDDLLARDEAQLVDEVAIARRGGDPLVLPARQRVRAGRADAQLLVLGDVVNLTSQRPQRGRGLAHVRARIGRDLEHGLHQFRLDLAVGRVLDQILDGVDQRVARRIQDHQLLLDPDRVRGAAELRLHVGAYSTSFTVPCDDARYLTMALGYDGKLYILAFDHRGSFQKKMFGIEGDPTPEETETIADAKKLIYEGMEKAVERGVDAGLGRRAGRRAVRRRHPGAGQGARPLADDAGREVRPERVRLPVRRRVRRAHREVRPARLQGARPLQPGRRQGDERSPGRAAQAAGRLAARERPQVPLRAARAGRGRPARVRRR